MTSESDDLKLQRLTDISFGLEYQNKWATKRTKDYNNINNLNVTNNNISTVTPNEIKNITNNLTNLYLEIDLLAELKLQSLNGKRLKESIINNLGILEDSLLSKLCSTNQHNLKLDNLMGINERVIYKHHFLGMLLQNLKDNMMLEVGQEYQLIIQDIEQIEDKQNKLKAGVAHE